MTTIKTASVTGKNVEQKCWTSYKDNGGNTFNEYSLLRVTV